MCCLFPQRGASSEVQLTGSGQDTAGLRAHEERLLQNGTAQTRPGITDLTDVGDIGPLPVFLFVMLFTWVQVLAHEE